MINVIEIKGHKAVITFDPEIEMFRGEFAFANGAADFYAKDVKGLKQEGEKSLNELIAFCEERGIALDKEFSGKFNVRIPPELHKKIAVVAKASGKSLNDVVTEALDSY